MGLDGWGAELRHALRTLRRTPGFTATVVGTLALAIGTIASVFTLLDRVVISPLPYGHPERLVFVAAEAPGSDTASATSHRLSSTTRWWARRPPRGPSRRPHT